MGVVDDLVNTEAAQKIGVSRRGCANDSRAPPLPELDSDMADPARRGMDEQRLPCLELRYLEERLPGGEGY